MTLAVFLVRYFSLVQRALPSRSAPLAAVSLSFIAVSVRISGLLEMDVRFSHAM